MTHIHKYKESEEKVYPGWFLSRTFTTNSCCNVRDVKTKTRFVKTCDCGDSFARMSLNYEWECPNCKAIRIGNAELTGSG